VALTAAEETGSCDVDGSGGDRRSRERQSRESDIDLESFVMKNETVWDGLLFIGSKISAVVLNQNRC
jgi:hypothetical protein